VRGPWPPFERTCAPIIPDRRNQERPGPGWRTAGRLLGTQHRTTILCQAALASTYAKAGRHRKATALSRQVLQSRGQVYGPDHPTTLNFSRLFSQIGTT
jgi:hypothetical protein